MQRLIRVLALLYGILICLSATQAVTLAFAPGPHLFSPPAAFEKAWHHDGFPYGNSGKYCGIGGSHPNANNDSCSYTVRGMYVSAIYEKGVAFTFRMPAYDAADGWGNKYPSLTRYWDFLTSLIPSGAKRYACKTVSPSDQGGSARTCLYHYRFRGGLRGGGNTLIVAQYLNPDEGGDSGIVEPDDLHLGFMAVHK
jgi:hypothetical protein